MNFYTSGVLGDVVLDRPEATDAACQTELVLIMEASNQGDAGRVDIIQTQWRVHPGSPFYLSALHLKRTSSKYTCRQKILTRLNILR